MNFTYNTKYKLFCASWAFLMLGIICDISLYENIHLFMFKLNLQTSSIVLITYIITFFLIIPFKEIKNCASDRSNYKYFIICFILLAVAFISSSLSDMPVFSITTTFFKYTLFFTAFISTVVYCRYFESAPAFILRSFIYFNVLIILSSFADFYFPEVNRVFIKYFGHMEGRHSNFKYNGVVYIRPSGFITDTNLTAFTLTLSCTLMLLNLKNFKNKFFIYAFYLTAGFSFGMLASRSALIAVIFSSVIFWIFKIVRRKEVVVFLLLFFLVQFFTPQTQARLHQIFNNEYMEEELGVGRPVIWNAAILAFKTKPVIGIGSGVFFKESYIFLNELINSYSQEYRDKYHLITQSPQGDGVNPHSIFLVMLAEYGITGLIIFLVLVFILFKDLFKKRYYNSVIIFAALLFVSTLSNYAPYYKYYMMLCIIFYVLSKSNMKTEIEENNNKLNPSDVKNILIIKICCLGDIVFITPMITALKKNYPEAKIYLVSSDWVRDIFPYLYGVDETIIFNSPLESNFISKVTGTIKLILKIRKLNNTLAVTTHRKNIFGLILLLSGIKYRLGFSGTKYLTNTAVFDDTIHETKRYPEILKTIGINSDEPAVLIQKKDKSEIRKEIDVKEKDFLISIFPFGGVNPGTNMTIKRWDFDKYIELVKKLKQYNPDVKILMFEGTEPGETPDARKLPDYVMVKKINDDIISVSNIFIAGDTGALHIAAALGVSTMALFGPSSPDLIAPLNYEGSGSIQRYIWKKPYCSPCYTPVTSVQKNNPKYWRGNTFICNTGTDECIKDISTDEVFETLKEMIQVLKT